MVHRMLSYSFTGGTQVKLKTWTGPCEVRFFAERLRSAGVAVTCEGTEHIYVDSPGSDSYRAGHGALERLRRAFGTTYGLRFQAII